ncbi:MAG: hypothetical protein KF901_07355 [Myxococcales bacterium]|nr:hypothetical protein [Myxococcales bacterium]
MKRTLTCPKCACTDILHVPQIADRNHTSVAPQSLVYSKEDVLGGIGVRAYATGELEAYVCNACGYVEQYLKEGIPVDEVFVKRLRGPRPAP